LFGAHSPLDRPPEAFPVVQGGQSPGKIKAKESKEVGTVSSWGRVETDAKPRQVLDPPMEWNGVLEMYPNQVDHAELVPAINHVTAY
jgi:hypothetical protein